MEGEEQVEDIDERFMIRRWPLLTLILSELYNIRMKQDPGILEAYSDKNFIVTDPKDGNNYVLKIVDFEESSERLNCIIDEITDNFRIYLDELNSNLVRIPKIIRTTENKLNARRKFCGMLGPGCHLHMIHTVKLFEYYRSRTAKSYIKNEPETFFVKDFFFKIGEICGMLHSFLKTQYHLLPELKKERCKFKWQLMTCNEQLKSILRDSLANAGGSLQIMAMDFEKHYKKQFDKLPEFILHGDLNLSNILIGKSRDEPMRLIDFQDLQVGPRIVDLAIAILYAIVDTHPLSIKDRIEKVPAWVVEGYQQHVPKLSDLELNLMPFLVRYRLCQSMVIGSRAYREDPDNDCVYETNIIGRAIYNNIKSLKSQSFVPGSN